MTMNEASCWTPARALALLLAALLLGFGLGLVPAAAAADAETAPEPVAPADCAEACRQRVTRWLEECVARGGEDCEAKAERHLAGCLAACDVPREAPPSCETACAERARTWHERCVAAGRENCDAEARKLHATCRESCPPRQVQPQPRPVDCETACAERARTWHERCEAAGRENCDAEARKLHATCRESCPPRQVQPQPRPVDCETACAERARTWHERCVAAGRENCGAEARKLHATCRESCPPRQVQPQPRPVDCETACAERARAWHQRCTAAGGENCGAEARKLLDRCRESCPPRATPIDCQAACRLRAAVWLERCVASGGRAACAERARGVLAQCLTMCDRGVGLEPQPPRQLVPIEP